MNVCHSDLCASSLAAQAAPARQDYAQLAKKYSKESAVEKDFVTLSRGNFQVMFERGKTVGVEKAVRSVMGLLEQAHGAESLALALAGETAAVLGGSLTAETEPGIATLFRFRLPLRHEAGD